MGGGQPKKSSSQKAAEADQRALLEAESKRLQDQQAALSMQSAALTAEQAAREKQLQKALAGQKALIGQNQQMFETQKAGLLALLNQSRDLLSQQGNAFTQEQQGAAQSLEQQRALYEQQVANFNRYSGQQQQQAALIGAARDKANIQVTDQVKTNSQKALKVAKRFSAVGTLAGQRGYARTAETGNQVTRGSLLADMAPSAITRGG